MSTRGIVQDPRAARSGVGVALRISYHGAPFSGFARQPERETIQGRVEEALRIALRREVVTVGAGRTDAGVHALGQVMSFSAEPGEIEPETLRRSLNALAGPRIAVSEVRLVPPGFDARHSAMWREYRYRLVSGPVPPLFLREYAWWVPPLDLRAMNEAAALLGGEHDFTSFCVAASVEGQRTTRTLDVLRVEPGSELGEECLVVTARARSFLHSMVRILVGTLVEVGVGRRSPRWALEALEARSRAAAGPTAPPHGLTLWRVGYPEEIR